MSTLQAIEFVGNTEKNTKLIFRAACRAGGKAAVVARFFRQLWQKTCTFDELLAAGRQPLAVAGRYFYKNRPGRQPLAVGGGYF